MSDDELSHVIAGPKTTGETAETGGVTVGDPDSDTGPARQTDENCDHRFLDFVGHMKNHFWLDGNRPKAKDVRVAVARFLEHVFKDASSCWPVKCSDEAKRISLDTLLQLAQSRPVALSRQLFGLGRQLLEFIEGRKEWVQERKHVSVAHKIIESDLTHTFDLVEFNKRVNGVFHMFYLAEGDYVAPYFVFVQSSGMGKTKLLYEYRRYVEGNKEEKVAARLVLCRAKSKDDKLGGEESELFDHFVPFQGLVREGADFSEAADEIFATLDRIFFPRGDHGYEGKLVLLFDEAHYLLRSRKQEDGSRFAAFLFRIVRLWICTKRGTQIVAVFTGTNAKLTEYRIDDDNFEQKVTDSRRKRGKSHERNFYRRGRNIFEPFYTLTTIGCLRTRQEVDLSATEYERAVPYGRPFFAAMTHEELSLELERIASRMVRNPSTWTNMESAWMSILGTRVQMGQMTIAMASDLVAHAYANLVGVNNESAWICFMPDPVCARLAMCLMDGKWRMPEPPLQGEPKRWWMQRIKEIYSSGLCSPEKGDFGEVMVALYFLFCADVLRSRKNSDYREFSVPLSDWIFTLVNGGEPPKPGRRGETSKAVERGEDADDTMKQPAPIGKKRLPLESLSSAKNPGEEVSKAVHSGGDAEDTTKRPDKRRKTEQPPESLLSGDHPTEQAPKAVESGEDRDDTTRQPDETSKKVQPSASRFNKGGDEGGESGDHPTEALKPVESGEDRDDTTRQPDGTSKKVQPSASLFNEGGESGDHPTEDLKAVESGEDRDDTTRQPDETSRKVQPSASFSNKRDPGIRTTKLRESLPRKAKEIRAAKEPPEGSLSRSSRGAKRKRPSPLLETADDSETSLSFGAIQICRNYLRSYNDSWKSLWEDAFLQHLYEAGIGFYVFPGCETIDLVFPLKLTEGEHTSYLPMFVSVKCHAYFSPAEASEECEKMREKAEAARRLHYNEFRREGGGEKNAKKRGVTNTSPTRKKKKGALCVLVVFASRVKSGDIANQLSDSCTNALCNGEIVSKVLRTPDDVFGISEVYLELTSQRHTSEILATHSFIAAQGKLDDAFLESATRRKGDAEVEEMLLGIVEGLPMEDSRSVREESESEDHVSEQMQGLAKTGSELDQSSLKHKPDN